MIYYELKKIWVKPGTKIAMLLLVILLSVVCYFAIGDIYYVNEQGEEEYGINAIQKLKAEKKQWAGILTEEVIAEVIAENARINGTEEYQAKDVEKNNIAYGWKQGFSDIRTMLMYSFCKFREADYYAPDSLLPSDAEAFYGNRIVHLQEWLDGEAKDLYSEEEKQFLIRQYETLTTPFVYDYTDGWKQLFTYAPTILMIMTMILGFVTAGIFSSEFSYKADAVFYTSYYGRGRAVLAKMKAAFFFVTVVYLGIMLLYSVIVLGICGADGAGGAIQTGMSGWKSFYHITYLQEYLLIVAGGYIGILFILFLTMLISAKTRSTALAATVPFILIFLPSFLSGNSLHIISKVLGLLPDQLLQMNMVIVYFNLYRIGDKIVGAVNILPVLYGAFTIILAPLLYQIYREPCISE